MGKYLYWEEGKLYIFFSPGPWQRQMAGSQPSVPYTNRPAVNCMCRIGPLRVAPADSSTTVATTFMTATWE
jgi:hypothetical protein